MQHMHTLEITALSFGSKRGITSLVVGQANSYHIR
jgi:hypothetical protein